VSRKYASRGMRSISSVEMSDQTRRSRKSSDRTHSERGSTEMGSSHGTATPIDGKAMFCLGVARDREVEASAIPSAGPTNNSDRAPGAWQHSNAPVWGEMELGHIVEDRKDFKRDWPESYVSKSRTSTSGSVSHSPRRRPARRRTLLSFEGVFL